MSSSPRGHIATSGWQRRLRLASAILFAIRDLLESKLLRDITVDAIQILSARRDVVRVVWVRGVLRREIQGDLDVKIVLDLGLRPDDLPPPGWPRPAQ